MHHRYCKHVEDKAESSNTLDVGENIAEIVIPLRIASIRQQKTLCVLQMQEMEWMYMDGIEYNNIEDVPVVKHSVVRTPVFDPITENLDAAVIFKTIVNNIWTL